MFENTYLTRDELFAAAAVFALLAWGFAFLFSVCQVWYPGSFKAVATEPRTLIRPQATRLPTWSAQSLQ